jgi:3-hydroxypropionyl-coenzyme A dehydratase
MYQILKGNNLIITMYYTIQFMSVKTGEMLINKGTDADIDTGLQLEIYGWTLCFAHEDRQKMMSAFLDKSKKK